MRKKFIISISIIFFAIILILGCVKIYRVYKARQCGILLAFDDYNAESWEEYFDLFDRYNAKVTFFVNATEPTDFCYDAIERGHEIAFHTINHIDMTTITEEEVYIQAIKPIETFREHGIELTSFSYPYGAYSGELNDLLLQYYKVLRGAYYYQVVGKDVMRHGFVESLSIDNIHYSSDEEFEKHIDSIIAELSRNKGAVVGLFSHAIGGGDWCITGERLEYLLQKANEAGIQFYTYKELQQD